MDASIQRVRITFEKDGKLYEKEFNDIINWNLTNEKTSEYEYYELTIEGLKIKNS